MRNNIFSIVYIVLFMIALLTVQSLEVEAYDDGGVDGDIEWHISDDTLVISPVEDTQGVMNDYDISTILLPDPLENAAPWRKSRGIVDVENIEIQDGVSNIGVNAFNGIGKASDSMSSIEYDDVELTASYTGEEIGSVRIPGSIEVVDNLCSVNCSELVLDEGVRNVESCIDCVFTTVRFPKSIEYISSYAFGGVDDREWNIIENIYGYKGTAVDEYISSQDEIVENGDDYYISETKFHSLGHVKKKSNDKIIEKDNNKELAEVSSEDSSEVGSEETVNIKKEKIKKITMDSNSKTEKKLDNSYDMPKTGEEHIPIGVWIVILVSMMSLMIIIKEMKSEI